MKATVCDSCGAVCSLPFLQVSAQVHYKYEAAHVQTRKALDICLPCARLDRPLIEVLKLLPEDLEPLTDKKQNPL
jgi:hypothetical protein